MTEIRQKIQFTSCELYFFVQNNGMMSRNMNRKEGTI